MTPYIVIHYSVCNLFLQSWGLTENALLWIQNQPEAEAAFIPVKSKSMTWNCGTSGSQDYCWFSGYIKFNVVVFFLFLCCSVFRPWPVPPEILIMTKMLLFGNWTPRCRLGHQSVSFTFTHTEKKQIVLFFSLCALRQEKYCFAVNF